MVKEGLHPKIVVHSKSLELLGQGEVCKDHVVDLSRYKSVFSKKTRFVTTYLLSRQVVASRPPWRRPSNGVQSTGGLESAAVHHRHVWVEK